VGGVKKKGGAKGSAPPDVKTKTRGAVNHLLSRSNRPRREENKHPTFFPKSRRGQGLRKRQRKKRKKEGGPAKPLEVGKKPSKKGAAYFEKK